MYPEDQKDWISLWEKSKKGQALKDWDYVHIINEAYKQKKYFDCLEIYKEFHKVYPESSLLDDKMGWALYHTYIKPFNGKTSEENRYRKQVDFIFSHSTSSQYSPRWCTLKHFIRMSKSGKLHMNPQKTNQLINGYLDMVDPDTLSDEEQTFQKDDGKIQRTSSDRETWYSEKTKALLKLNAYEECIKTAEQAMSVLTSFHNNNDSWFIYRKVKSLIALNRSEDALNELQSVLRRGFSHWCIFSTAFEAERVRGDIDAAMRYGAACALADPSHNMRVAFYEEYAGFLLENGMEREAMLHRRFVVLLRMENNWPLNTRQSEWTFTDEISAMDIPEIKHELTGFWQSVTDQGMQFYEGQIEKLLPSGHDGFIRLKESHGRNNSYYFKIKDVRGPKCRAVPGVTVRFALEDRFDRKKNISKPTAVRISFI